MKVGRIKTVSNNVKMSSSPAPASINTPASSTYASATTTATAPLRQPNHRAPATASTAPLTTNSTRQQQEEDERCKKVKRFVGGGLLIVLIVIGWHLYEHFTYDPLHQVKESPMEHEIHEFTRSLYELEVQHNPYLAKVNFQGRTKASYRDDRAQHPLLQVNEDLLASGGEETRTIVLMRRLFDNYELDTHTVEHVTAEEEQEEDEFLKAILATPVMQRTMKFLEFKGVATNNKDSQLHLLKDMWFSQYSRGQGRIGSSGFEHVFLAEIREGNILGLHNWIYFHEQEKLGHLDYKGHIEKLNLEKDGHYLMSLRFSFHRINKPYNTLFVGTSPELEMSLYTMCFLLSVGQPCAVQLGHVKFSIITHAWDWHGKKMVATAYPSLEN
ncbi:endoribonuclease CG2145 [Stomoxys calcitrans]|uniref:endoribonuclease CG2145 n=1 Tax=Stomoxys calcitrans TaxID=35570 RepID=UPI0027E39BCF|nr:endoribonuclease CG2145 [Stomoxys calcitrans]